MAGLFNELKRRNVFRVGVAYAIVGWLLLEVASVIFPGLHLPDWTLTFLIVLVVAGFPLALILAWAFEMTPEGVKREAEVDRTESITRVTGRKFDFAIIGLLAIAVVYFAVDKFGNDEPKPPPVAPEEILTAEPIEREKSIAVLLFDNLSGDATTEPFTKGIHDDILTQLSKISALKVIARTTMERLDPTLSIPEIGTKLDVATVLEGGVQRAGDRVRINVQLIDCADEAHLWAETYDRELTAANIFSIQSDVAQQIASALRVKLTATERVRIEKTPTENLHAYNLYLLGRHHRVQSPSTQDSLDTAASYLQQAIDEDPAFGAAYAELAYSHWLRVVLGAPMELEFERIRHLVETAIALDPDSAEVNYLMAWVHAWDGDLQAGDARMTRVLELAPSAASSYGNIADWFRPVDDRIAYVRIATQLDPLSLFASISLVWNLLEARRFTEAAEAAESAYALDRDGAVLTLANAYFFADRKEEARETYLRALELYGSLERSSDTIATLAYINGMLGHEEQARVLLRDLEGMSQAGHVAPRSAALAYASIGDSDRTLHWIERGIEEERNWYGFPMLLRPLFDFLRADPRYSEVLGRANPEILDRLGFER
jgi:TolB-like protein/Tfp pilus assembly protein PilF